MASGHLLFCTLNCALLGVEGDATGVFNSEKHAQIAVGTNSVTRCLERGALRAAVVCLSSSARPLLVHRHLMMLSASRGVPCAALPGLGSSLAPLLGIKNVLAIGFKVRGCTLLLHACMHAQQPVMHLTSM